MAAVLIFGGASGIGRATAHRFRQEDWTVHVADIVPCPDGRGRVCDVRKTNDIQAAFDWAGPLDAMIYCVGMQHAMPADKNYVYCVADLFHVNAFGAIDAMRSYSERHAEGVATLVASVAGITSGGPGLSAYGAAKAAVIGFTKSMALELAPRFRVNCVAPGWTNTPFNDPVVEYMGGRQKQAELVSQTVPLARQAEANEIANAIWFVTSSEGSYVNGHTLVVDGGLTV